MDAMKRTEPRTHSSGVFLFSVVAQIRPICRFVFVGIPLYTHITKPLMSRFWGIVGGRGAFALVEHGIVALFIVVKR